jgi:hypothetical protein
LAEARTIHHPIHPPQYDNATPRLNKTEFLLLTHPILHDLLLFSLPLYKYKTSEV